MKPIFWTEEKVSQLKAMIKYGKSLADIAKSFPNGGYFEAFM